MKILLREKLAGVTGKIRKFFARSERFSSIVEVNPKMTFKGPYSGPDYIPTEATVDPILYQKVGNI